MRCLKFQTAFRLLGTLSIAIALFSLSGGHWALLQGIAWSRMIQTYATQGSFQSAVQKTFDGRHRCSLCKKIEQAKQQEKKKSFVNETFKKKEGILERSFLLLTLVPSDFYFFQMEKSLYSGPIMSPLLPPPRIA